MITVLYSGNPQREKLDAIQAQIADLTAQRKTIANADLATDDLRASCDAAVRDIIDGPAGISMQSRIRYLAQPGRPTPLIEQDDTSRDFAALVIHMIGEDTIANRLFDRVSTHEKYTAGLPASERAARIAELDKQIRRLSVAEEIEARKIESQGVVFVMRRPLAALDIDAVLEAWDKAGTAASSSAKS